MIAYSICLKHCKDLITVKPHLKISEGADGEVFLLEDDPNKVIKFGIQYFDDQDSLPLKKESLYKVFNYLIESKLDTNVHIYEYKYLGDFYRDTVNGKQFYILYYYIMEKLFKLSEDEKKVFHSIISHEDMNIKKNYSVDDVNKMLAGMSMGLDFDAGKVIFFYAHFRKMRIQHNDLHVRNIMKDCNGNFKLIDFDRSDLI